MDITLIPSVVCGGITAPSRHGQPGSPHAQDLGHRRAVEIGVEHAHPPALERPAAREAATEGRLAHSTLAGHHGHQVTDPAQPAREAGVLLLDLADDVRSAVPDDVPVALHDVAPPPGARERSAAPRLMPAFAATRRAPRAARATTVTAKKTVAPSPEADLAAPWAPPPWRRPAGRPRRPSRPGGRGEGPPARRRSGEKSSLRARTTATTGASGITTSGTSPTRPHVTMLAPVPPPERPPATPTPCDRRYSPPTQ